MANPFTTRATEFVKSNEAFLSLVTPDPISFFLEPYAQDNGLYRRLVSIQGQPGSGKTTIARMFEFSTLAALLRGGENETYSELIGPLQKCGAVKEGQAQIIGCRLPLESDYRELWQLPYSEIIRTELLSRLIQARSILAWFSQLKKLEIKIEDISFEVRDGNYAALTFIGGSAGPGILERAKRIEAAIYSIVGSLLPPSEADIDSRISDPYRPFDILDHIRISDSASQIACSNTQLRPLVILDDVHFLHPAQLIQLKQWLVRRELNLGRWMLSRLDVLQPKELFDSIASEDVDIDMPGITAERDIIPINLQSPNRKEGRKNFRGMTREMSKKYLRQIKIFEQSSITSLETILPESTDSIAPSNLLELRQSIKTAAKRLHVSDERLDEFDKMSAEFLVSRSENSEELRLAMTRVLVHRYAKRTPQASLFPDESGPEPNKPLRADLPVYEGAKIHLLHQYDRPYYVGFDSLSDAASENAETFLRIASHIVEASENLLIKQKSGALQPREQNKLITERATQIIDTWKFPEHRRIRILASWIADKCVARTLEFNAPLGHGANAYGVPMDEFEKIGTDFPVLANLLKFAVAYNAILLVPNHDCKNRKWCLLELGGIFIVKSRLPFKRGGFVEGSSDELNREITTKP
jgi:hypothetical protein